MRPRHALAPPRPGAASAQAGLTILELMVVVSVTALILGLAAPALDSLLARQRLRTASYDLVTDLTLARSESLKRAADVQLLPATGSDWRTGWRLTTGNGELLAQRSPLGGSVQVLTAPASVRFDARGYVDASAPVKFGLADGRGQLRCILLDPSGRPRSQSAACSP